MGRSSGKPSGSCCCPCFACCAGGGGEGTKEALRGLPGLLFSPPADTSSSSSSPPPPPLGRPPPVTSSSSSSPSSPPRPPRLLSVAPPWRWKLRFALARAAALRGFLRGRGPPPTPPLAALLPPTEESSLVLPSCAEVRAGRRGEGGRDGYDLGMRIDC